MYAIYGNIDHQYTPVMLAYIPYMDIYLMGYPDTNGKPYDLQTTLLTSGWAFQTFIGEMFRWKMPGASPLGDLRRSGY